MIGRGHEARSSCSRGSDVRASRPPPTGLGPTRGLPLPEDLAQPSRPCFTL
jgi:hypothetical protein